MIIRIKRPYIIGVTGTVGKTTISSHVATYLQCEFGKDQVLISPYHYNGEYGVPLSIIQTKTGGKNPFRWLIVFLLSFIRITQSYPRYVVLEYGIDHPGEMDYLLSIAQPDIVIISMIAPNHLEQFGTIEKYRSEKLKIVHRARHCIIHESLRQYIDRDVVYYSLGGMSDIDASHTHMTPGGVSAIVHTRGDNYPIDIPAFGAYQIENILPIYAIAHILGRDLAHIADYSRLFLPEPGRSSILAGKNRCVIIDGSYNGGHESICRGIDSIIPFAATHRIMCMLGDMRELGNHSEGLHVGLAHYILEHINNQHNIEFFLVGPMMYKYVFPLLSSKYPVRHSLSSRDMGTEIARLLTGDKPTIVYVKGSQNTIFLEEGIKKFLLHQVDANRLCRQSEEWMKKKESFFSTL